jgi:hypothetical protein
MTKSQERKLNHAIRILEIKYQVALSKPDIKYPLAWALYQTWQDEDIKSRTTKGKKWKVTYYCTECIKMNTDGCPYHTRGIKDKACEDFLGANGEEIEIWNSTHGQTIAPKGTFMKIYNECKEDEDDI